MPAHDRDRKVREEAQFFCEAKSTYPQPCHSYKPTLDEIKATTFYDYVRNVVLRKAERYENDETQEMITTSELLACNLPTCYGQGMSKVTLPEGFKSDDCASADATGRGPDWQPGTPLGDMVIPSPIKQCIRGIGGLYEFTFLDQPPISVANFREKADEYFKEQVGHRGNEESVDLLERKFWKRLGPTMIPSMYGADMEGSLFGEGDCCGWNVAKLQSCLQLLLSDQPANDKGGIPGVTSPYLYFGMWASVFCAHTEDMNLLSINYLHAGAPKVWYAIAPGEDAKRFEHFCEGNYHQSRTKCPEYLRHKRCLVSPHVLKKSGIRFTKAVQYPGDAIITFPGGYHFGFNTGFNVAEATNFAVPEWVAYGKLAKVCLCRPDSVRIDMHRFERLMYQYEKQRRNESRRLSWKDWAQKQASKKHQTIPPKSKATECDEIQRKETVKKDFWVEVVQPFMTKSRTNKSKSKKRQVKQAEIWHLAKPVSRKSLRPGARVLCLVATIADTVEEIDEEDESEKGEEVEDEQCFTGVVIELSDDHVRVHLNGLAKKDDVWLSVHSPKLFLDGGCWDECEAATNLPPKHYWKVEDSKRRCI